MYYSYVLFDVFVFFNDTATTEIYTYGHTLSLHDALPIGQLQAGSQGIGQRVAAGRVDRAEAEAAIIGGQHHARPRLGVPAIGDGAGEEAADQIGRAHF